MNLVISCILDKKYGYYIANKIEILTEMPTSMHNIYNCNTNGNELYLHLLWACLCKESINISKNIILIGLLSSFVYHYFLGS